LISTTNGAGDTTTYAYDKRNQMTGIIDPENNIWGFSYDGLGRLIRATDPELDETESNFDSANDMMSFDDGRNLTTTFEYNGFGEVVREISPDRGTRDYAYDQAGRLTSITTADGDVEQRAYDAGGRLTVVTFPGSPMLDQTLTYDATTTSRGHLTGVTDDHGTVSYTYNLFGDLLSETRTINTQTYVTSYQYDRLGQPTRVTYPSGLQVNYDRDNLGRLTRITATPSGGTAVNIATNLSWLPMGPLRQYTSANNMVTTRSHDSAYRLSGFSVADGTDVRLDKTIGRDGVGRITSISDALISARSATYEYTDDGRLERAVGLWGEYQWSYDAVGNRLSESEFDNFVEVSRHDYAYGAADNRLVEISDAPGSVIRTFAHRAGGDMTADTNTLGDNYTYEYDGSGRLKTVRKNGTVAASYGYDTFERRVIRTVAGVEDHYIFEGSGRPLSEHAGATGVAQREYIWLGDMLVAVVQSGNVYAVHGGHLGQPLLMTDELGNEVWNAEYAPFGGALPSIDFDDPSVRYPGQWAEGETQLFQNWHRDYDPSLGRYIEADPLGLAAGQSLYGYVSNDPVNYVDPQGLELKAIGSPSFVRSVNGMLDDISDAHPDLAEMINDLRCSENSHTIVQKNLGEDTRNIPQSIPDSSNGEGTNTVTRIDPENPETYRGPDGEQITTSPEAELTHELRHAHDADLGVTDRSYPGSSTRTRHEQRAIDTANTYR
ncbi:MAG: RHS repeat-associated core domain-containing protein, partial [Pseudomonadota bacterium]